MNEQPHPLESQLKLSNKEIKKETQARFKKIAAEVAGPGKLIPGDITSPKGYYAEGLHAGLKKSKKDFGILYSQTPAAVAGVFTTNKVKAATIAVDKKVVEHGSARAIVVNSGIANACTGKVGTENALKMQALGAEKLNISPAEVAICSTGVIGTQLPMEIVEKGFHALTLGQKAGHEFAKSILTTDTQTKEIVYEVEIDGKAVRIAGAAKGSGMIHPNMATMLAFITTDAAVEQKALQALLADSLSHSFNQITVDGDTSTNDTVLVLANGAAGNAPLSPAHPEWQKFADSFLTVAQAIAKMIAADGEGATKLIEVQVNGAETLQDGNMIAKGIVGSNLVKAAMFGEDPNWGRIICAVGYTGGKSDPMKTTIEIGDVLVFENGMPVPFSEAHLRKILSQEKITIKADLHEGEAVGRAWGCDLTYNYVKINAAYHT